MLQPYLYETKANYVPAHFDDSTGSLKLFPKRSEPLRLDAQRELPEEHGWLSLTCADYYGRAVSLLWVRSEELEKLVGCPLSTATVHDKLRERIFTPDMQRVETVAKQRLTELTENAALRLSKQEEDELPYSVVVSAKQPCILVGFGELVGEGCFKKAKALHALGQQAHYVQLFPKNSRCAPIVDHATSAHHAALHYDGIARAVLVLSDKWPDYKRGLLMQRASSTLADVISSDLTKPKRLKLLQRLATILSYLAERHVYHQDVKPENALLFGEQLRLSDCDALVRVQGQDAQDLAAVPVSSHRKLIQGGNRSCGAPEHVQEELVDLQDLDLYYERKDAYSLGAIITMLWLGIHEIPEQTVLCGGARPPFTARLALFAARSEDPVLQLAQELLSWQPADRPRLSEATERLAAIDGNANMDYGVC